jgi:hypothetical protein
MNEVIARATRLLQNQELIGKLAGTLPNNLKAFANPQALNRLASLSPGVLNEEKLKLLSGIGNTVSGLLKGFSGQTSNRAPQTRAHQPSPSPGVRANGNKGAAIAAAVSLTAVAGAVVAVGTVSAVALAKSRSNRQA